MITRPFDVTGGAADRLDQRAARPQVALLVGVEDADEAHLRQVEALAQQVDADDHVVHAEAQVAQDLDALEGVDLGVQVVGADAHLLQVVREVLGHLLRQRRDEDALAGARRAAAPRPAGRRSGPSSACTSISGSMRPVGRMICSTTCSRVLLLVRPGRRRDEDDAVDVLLELLEVQRAVVQRRRQAEAVVDQRLSCARRSPWNMPRTCGMAMCDSSMNSSHSSGK